MAHRRRSKHQKESKNNLESSKLFFGQPLVAEGMEEKCCMFVEDCLKFLEDKGVADQQGLFRLCGCKTQIDELKELADSDICAFQIPQNQEAHNIAGLLKQYFREMPVPLIPFNLTNKFISAVCVTEDKKEEEIKKAIALLPSTNKYILGKLCMFMYQVQLHKDSNLMSSENLSTCIGPNLLRSEIDDPRMMIVNGPHVNALFTYLFSNANLFFENIERYRPLVRKRAKSLSHLNKLMFIIYLPPIEKKSIIINPSEKLQSVLQKICFTRGMEISSYVAIDGNGQTVEMERQLGDIEGRCITLVPKEMKQTATEPELPSAQDFLFPLPNNPLTSISAIPPITNQNRRTHHPPPRKAFSSTLLPRVKPGERLVPNTAGSSFDYSTLSRSRTGSFMPKQPGQSFRGSNRPMSSSGTPAAIIEVTADTEQVGTNTEADASNIDNSTTPNIPPATISAPTSTSTTPRANRRTLGSIVWEEACYDPNAVKGGPPPPVYVPAPPKVDDPPTISSTTTNPNTTSINPSSSTSTQKEKTSRRNSKKRKESKEKPNITPATTSSSSSSSSSTISSNNKLKKRASEDKKYKSNGILQGTTRENVLTPRGELN